MYDGVVTYDMGAIEVETDGGWLMTYRPICPCGWVGMTTTYPKDAAIHLRQHREEAHR